MWNYIHCLKRRENYTKMKILSTKLAEDSLSKYLNQTTNKADDVYRHWCKRELQFLQQKTEIFK